MNKVHTTLHLQHHRHTGRLLHHRHTSYRGLAVVFLLAGLFMVGLHTAATAAADNLFGVQATVMAPVPTSSATIAKPLAGASLPSTSLYVVGTCPFITPQVSVVIAVDGAAAGSGVCDSQNDYVVPITMPNGSHELVAQTYTITGQRGPDSAPVSVSTAPKVIASSGPSFTADQPLALLAAGTTLSWTGSVSGGTPPYKLQVQWGDGHEMTKTIAAGPQQLDYSYATAVPRNVTMILSDATGATTALQYAAAAYSVAAPTPVASDNSQSMTGAKTAIGLYGLYITALAVTGIVALESRKLRKEHRFAS